MRAVYLIKPEGLSQAKKIRQELELTGLHIAARTTLTLTQADIETLYYQESAYPALNKTNLAGAEVEAGMVEGENAIKLLLTVVKKLAEPVACPVATQPNLLDDESTGLQSQPLCLTAMAVPATESEANRWLQWYQPRHFEQVREAVIKELQKYCNEKERWRHHFLPVVRYAKQLAHQVGADLEVVELAAWLHDFTRIQGDDEDHHLSGAEEARKLLEGLHYDQAKIEEVCHCILSHRGSDDFPARTIEAKIVASADAMAHIGYAPTALFSVKRKKVAKAVKLIRKRAKRNWRKIMREGREIIQPQYTALKILLSNYKSKSDDFTGFNI